jgi:hypothetical protein
MTTQKKTESPISSEFDEYDEISQELEEPEIAAIQSSAITTTDWTVDTLVNQLKKGNFDLSPQFQRRFAWRDNRKSQFIESLALGFPVPHIVLARDKTNPSKLIVLDGKQRLMTLAQFYGLPKLGTVSTGLTPLKLSSLKVKKTWNGETLASIKKNKEWKPDFDAFENATMRSVIITTWTSEDFLYSIFIRLNQGSLPLSPQELRQALKPGPFATYAENRSGTSIGLRLILGLSGPDFRMRDVELLIRFISFRTRGAQYGGNMKAFLDDTCGHFNQTWTAEKANIENECKALDKSISTCIAVFGQDGAFRKYVDKSYEPRINRAIFDVVSYAFAEPKVRSALKSAEARGKLKKAFEQLCADPKFLRSIEATTKTSAATYRRYADFLGLIKQHLKVTVPVPVPKT